MATQQDQSQYFKITVDQLEAEIKQQAKFLLPEITNQTDDVLIRGYQVHLNILERMILWINLLARESQPATALLFRSQIASAQSFDYRVQGAKPERVEVTFTFDINHTSDFLIPAGTLVSDEDNTSVFRTVQDATIAQNTAFVKVLAEQKEIVQPIAPIAQTTGDKFQVVPVTLNDEGFFIVDNSILATIAGNTYVPIDSFFFAEEDSLVFIQRINQFGLTEILLGDGINGVLPASGVDINVSYFKTQGTSGRVAAGQIDTIISTLPPPVGITLTVTNELESADGAQPQTTEDLRRILPRLRNTNERGVTLQDFKDLAESFPQVAKAAVVETPSVQNTDVNVYFIPTSGDLPSAQLISDLNDYMQLRKIIGINLGVLAAGRIDVLLEFDLIVDSGFNQTEVVNNVVNSLELITDINNQDSPVEIGGELGSDDIIDAPRDVAGVKRFILKVFSLRPFARPLTGKTLNWDVEMLSGSTTQSRFLIIFQTTNNFDVIQNELAVATNQNVGDVVNINGVVEFVINSPYVAQDVWEFYTYPYLGDRNGVYSLAEPSFFNISQDNMNINASGGITA